MPATSRSGRAARVVSAACALVPSLLGLPLLAGAFIAALWLFGASPAHADGLALDGARPLSDAVPLSGVVGVTDPVTATLGTVHQGLEDRAERTAGATEGLSDPADAVGGVGVGARRVVEEISPDRWDAPAAELLPGLAAGPEEGRVPAPREESAPAPAEDVAEHPAPSVQGDDPAPAPAPDSDSVRWRPAAEAAAADAPARTDEAPRVDPRDAERLGGHLTAGSAPTSGSASPVPGVAGYLTATFLAAPASVPASPVGARLHSVPVDPADDPTVSPD